MHPFVICALYKFVRLENFQTLRQPLLEFLLKLEIRGTLLLAREGINGTVCGTRETIDALLDYLNKDDRLAEIVYKESYADESPFLRTKVKLKKEIVTMGVEDIDPTHIVGTYVKPQDWNQLISEEDVILIDTRNDYEFQVGTFQKAVNPNTESFREFPAYVKTHLDPNKHKRVAMFCTGGIRCEKSTAYLKEQGFEEVYHLEGGILKYLEEVPAAESMWEGECYVFDERVTVNHQLEKGHYDQCHACRLPITEEDKLSPQYEVGISCPRCYDKTTDAQKARFREREKQVQLARQRGQIHLGTDSAKTVEENRKEKQLKREQDRSSAMKKHHR